MNERDDFLMIDLKTESGEIFRVPILRDADEIEISFYPQTSEPQRDVFCLMTKQFREGRQMSSACFGSRCSMCRKPYIRGDSTDTCDECSIKKYQNRDSSETV